MPALGSLSFTSAVTNLTSAPITGLGEVGSLNLVCKFAPMGGGTTCVARVQTSLNGSDWYDIARFDFTTTGAVKRACCDGRAGAAPAALAALGSESKIDGLIGDRLRVSVDTVGTYSAGSGVSIDYQTQSN
jgi:hypothetical protein